MKLTFSDMMNTATEKGGREIFVHKENELSLTVSCLPEMREREMIGRGLEEALEVRDDVFEGGPGRRVVGPASLDERGEGRGCGVEDFGTEVFLEDGTDAQVFLELTVGLELGPIVRVKGRSTRSDFPEHDAEGIDVTLLIIEQCRRVDHFGSQPLESGQQTADKRRINRPGESEIGQF